MKIKLDGEMKMRWLSFVVESEKKQKEIGRLQRQMDVLIKGVDIEKDKMWNEFHDEFDEMNEKSACFEMEEENGEHYIVDSGHKHKFGGLGAMGMLPIGLGGSLRDLFSSTTEMPFDFPEGITPQDLRDRMPPHLRAILDKMSPRNKDKDGDKN